MRIPAPRLVFATFAVLLLGTRAPSVAAQQSASSTEGALFLLLPVGAKAVALGRAMTALPGAESVWWNPAGLGELSEGRFLAYRSEDLYGEATAASVLFVAPRAGSVGLSYQLVDLGELEVTDDENNTVGAVSFRDHLGVASVAAR